MTITVNAFMMIAFAVLYVNSVDITKCGKEDIYMQTDRLLKYSMQLAMLKQLRELKLINDVEYRLIENRLKKDYGVVSNITT